MIMNYKHLTHDNRKIIEYMLNTKKSFKEIARTINVDSTTISKEVRKNRMLNDIGAIGRIKNRCIYRKNCFRTNLCENKSMRECNYSRCSACTLCNKNCPDFVEEVCPNHKQPPYVCNGCSLKSSCVLKKYIYDHDYAHKAYKIRLTESRKGFRLTLGELLHIESVVKPLVIKGQSIHHIVSNNKDVLMISERTLYRIVESCETDIRNIDLPMKVKRKETINNRKFTVDRSYLDGRTYDDFLKFINENPDVSIVQMDTVEGVKGGAVLLTIIFVNVSLMLAYLRVSNNARSVVEVIDYIYNTLGHGVFVDLFPVFLMDRGNEFTDPKAIEFNKDGERRTRVFYCNPGSPEEKGACEKNHVEIRKILPKGTSFDNLTQEDINLVMSHINSYSRKKLNGKSPYQAFSFYFAESILNKLGIDYIAPNDVIMNPSLIKK